MHRVQSFSVRGRNSLERLLPCSKGFAILYFAIAAMCASATKRCPHVQVAPIGNAYEACRFISVLADQTYVRSAGARTRLSLLDVHHGTLSHCGAHAVASGLECHVVLLTGYLPICASSVQPFGVSHWFWRGPGTLRAAV